MAQAIPNPTDCCTTCDCTDTQTAQSLTGAIVANFSFANYAAARAFSAFVADMVVGILGATVRSDGGEGMFYYNATSTTADDGATVLRPNNIAVASAGRLIRMIL